MPRKPHDQAYPDVDQASGTEGNRGPNFSPDGRTLYFVDTLPHRRLEAITLYDGTPGERSTIAEISGGNPDRLVLDEGCVWVAVWDASELRRYAPTGELLARVELPVPKPTAVCFQGGTLVITTASLGLGRPPAGITCSLPTSASPARRTVPGSGGLRPNTSRGRWCRPRTTVSASRARSVPRRPV
ncbi:hypothetical protein E1218_06970 [Kribbella turkmenica]|uniref:SMP-30/Gluconolactonase/LRE-like region domain-containing protein n=1 Tax=Kribbella turkmenica TaxID=2530375 RepID=A0A4R4XD14_9ACTN|nr:SMP-30/gluconolactonase/LRE family protein [Kribbella turkmenica]TDD28553.1 hypothetical protein E1218_06970 [Kribbella turkmenica]